MRFFDPTIHPMSKVLQRMELIMLGMTIIARFTVEEKLELSASNIWFFIFCVFVILLGLRIPLEKPLWQRRIHAAASMAIVILALVTGYSTDLLFYWNIIKISCLLDVWEAIIAVLIAGVTHITGLVVNYSNIAAMAAKHGVIMPSNPQIIIAAQIVSYIGASILCLLISTLILAERRSRIKNAILTDEVKNLAADLERQRIAREIHDSLGHSLTALDIQLEIAQKLQKIDLSQTAEAINRAKSLTSQCLQDVRSAVGSIRSEPFDLQESLGVLVDRFRPSFKVHIQLELPSLPFQSSHQLYCILQEGFTNIQKHAAPQAVLLKGNYDDRQLWIQLQDDGRGFEQARTGGGFGLRSMSERAQLLGGQLQVESSPRGTNILISIPLHDQ